MRIVLLLVILMALFACKKEKVELTSPAKVQSYYQSQGNLLVLEIGDKLEAVYEYNLPTLQIDSDTLALSYEKLSVASMDPYIVWKINPIDQVLFYAYQQKITYLEKKIEPTNLEKVNSTLPYDSAQFHLVENNLLVDLKILWDKVNNLRVLNAYRNQNANKKMSILRIVKQVYDESLGFSYPSERHLLIICR